MQPGDVVDDRFELVDIAGSGGMGAVFRARDRFGEQVAVKVMGRTLQGTHDDRFAREIRVLAQLRHPGIVRYIADGVSTAGEMWLAMEWLEGEPLGARLRRTGITATDAVAVVRRVSEALGAAHALGIVHRDVKPSNLFVVRDDLTRVKLLDFGVARISEVDRFSTRTGVMIGTPGYMAPEQARGDREVGVRSDVFALGCVLFELLTGQHAFVGDNVMAVLAKILLEDAPRVAELRPELPHELDELVARTLSKRPADRPADGGQLAAALGALGEIEALDAANALAPRKALTSSERRLLSVVLIGGGERELDTFDDERANEATLAQTDTPETAPGQPALSATFAALKTTAIAHGAMLDRLVDGSHVVTLSGSGTAGDQAMQAARCALALKHVAPHAPMALATGRGVLAGRWPVGEAIDRAARFLGAGPNVRIDDVTAGLLDARFELGGDAQGLLLVGERDITETARTLLGKATPCVGRDRELGVLNGLWDECISEPLARAVAVVGASGIGKSRVRVEVLRKIHARGEPVEVWIGRGDPLKVGSPYGMLAPALRRAAGIRDGEPLEVRQHKLRARIARNATVVDAVFLAELIGAPYDDADLPALRAARQDPPLMAEQIRQAFVQLVAAETAAQPLAIVFEDLHWGDLTSVKLIDAVLRELPDRPIFVLALARPELHDMFPRLWVERGAQEMRLDELTRKGSERLVRGVLGETASDALVARLVEQAAGNAFYLEELIRATAEGKGDAMPETVLAVVHSRLERLELDARRVLRAASVFGNRFWRGGVLALLGDEARRTGTQDWLDELCERELVAPVGAGRFPNEREFQFRHSIVREAAYAMLTDADRKLGHQLAGEWLFEQGEADPLVLADHFDRAGDSARASGLYRSAAVQAMVACDFRGALALADRAEAAGSAASPKLGRAQTDRAFIETAKSPRPTHGDFALLRAECHHWLGEIKQAAGFAEIALKMLRRDTREYFFAMNEAAIALGKLGDAEGLERIAGLLQAAPRSIETLGSRVIATANTAFQLFSYGRQQLAQELLDDVERAAPQVADEPAIMARIYQARSSRSMLTGDVGAYLESELAAFAAFETAADLRNACMQRGHVGYACLEIGAYAEAEEALRDALERAIHLNLHNVIATAKHNLGRALAARGELAEGARVEAEAVAAFEAQGDRRLIAGARYYLGAIYYEQGLFANAETELGLALASSLLPMQAPMRATLARIHLANGRVADAIAEATRAMEIMTEVGAVEEGEALVRLVRAETLLGTDRPAARAAIIDAKARLLARADRISDARYRSSFLQRISDHARTFDLASRLA